MERNVSFIVDGKTYSVSKPGLRKWLELEETNKQILEFMRDKNIVEVANSICSYLSCIVEIENIHFIFWKEIVEAYIEIATLCIPSIDLPLLHGKTDEKKDGWDYDQRTWYLWSHLLASRYGWTLEYIADIEFEDALALLQEIFVEDQLNKEWQWSLSELAYPYNKITQKSEYKPLSRPSWMGGTSPTNKATRPVKMPVDMLPVGIVMKWDSDEKVIN